MAGTNIADGSQEAHDDGVLPLLDTGPGITALAGVTPVASIVPDNRFDPGDYGAVLDTTGMNLQQQAEGTADAQAAMASGMSAKHGLNDRYEAQGMALGGSIGDAMDLPVVPTNAVPPAMSDLYPFSGQEPTEAAAGMAGPYPNTGNTPA